MPTESIYGGKGWLSSERPVCKTVGELIDVLKKVPRKVPIGRDHQLVTWYNLGERGYGLNGEHIAFEEPEDDDEEDDEDEDL